VLSKVSFQMKKGEGEKRMGIGSNRKKGGFGEKTYQAYGVEDIQNTIKQPTKEASLREWKK